jgi:hypothetical protein
MRFKITASTDNKFIGTLHEDNFPITLGDRSFSPDFAPIPLGNDGLRYFNSNYSIDVEKVS